MLGAREVLAEEHRLVRVDDVDRHEPGGETRRGLDRLREPLAEVGLHHEPVDDHLDRVLALLVEDDLLLEQPLLAVHLDAREAVGAQLLEHVLVLALAVAHDRRVDRELRPLGQLQHLVDDRLLRLAGDRAPADRAVRTADARVEQPQVVVDLRHGADGGARVARRRLLVDGDGRREAVDRVDVGLLHHLEELARVRGERLDVAALPLGVDRVEGEARLPRAGEPGDRDQLVPRQADGDVLEVVLAGAVNDELFLRHNLRVYRADQTGTCVRSSAGLPALAEGKHPFVRTVRRLLRRLRCSLVAGCGGDDGDEETTNGTSSQTFSISETDFTLTPSTVTIDAPGTYTFEATNDGGIDHALEIEGQRRRGERRTRSAQASPPRVTVDLESGTYEMYCPIGSHRDLGHGPARVHRRAKLGPQRPDRASREALDEIARLARVRHVLDLERPRVQRAVPEQATGQRLLERDRPQAAETHGRGALAGHALHEEHLLRRDDEARPVPAPDRREGAHRADADDERRHDRAPATASRAGTGRRSRAPSTTGTAERARRRVVGRRSRPARRKRCARSAPSPGAPALL